MRRRKPDLMIVLAALIGIGVLVTGLSQGAMRDDGRDARISMVDQR
jgi:hypothetical protein